jgi:adenylosuccinate lyase
MPDEFDTFVSPLASRNSSREMLRFFSARYRIGLWRRSWLTLATIQRELGVSRVTAEALSQMSAHLDDIDFARAADWEKRLRHDVMAHVHTFEEAAPAAKGIVHLGATSMDIVDTAEAVILRDALTLIAQRLAASIDALATFSLKHKSLATLGYTHFQPAQLTTVGKRATLWAQGLVLALEEIESVISRLRFRGLKGATGTQASFLALFGNDASKVEALETKFAQQFGFDKRFEVAGQTYPRELDAIIVNALAVAAAAVHKCCNDIRILSGLKQIDEPFETEQVGSSAMAYKRNPQRCERATGLARFVISLASSPLMTAAEQWLERTLDDSANKRLAVAEAFLATDGLLLIMTNVARGLVVYPATIQRFVNDELPFMASEEILMAAVNAGGDRQHLHEVIRTHSMAAAANVKQLGQTNDLIARLKSDPAFKSIDLDSVLDPSRHIGRCVEQTEKFVAHVVEPIRAKYKSTIGAAVELKV